MKSSSLQRSVRIALAVVLALTVFPMNVFAYDSFSTWKSRFDTSIANMDNPTYYYGYTDSPRSEYLAWNGAYTVNGLLRMYQLTKDSSYMAKSSEYIDNMYTNLGDVNGDGYLGWGSTHYDPDYTEYIVHYGMVISEWARFILLVRADSELAASMNPQGIAYASQATALENMINTQLIPRWNTNWSLEHNVYLNEYTSFKSLPNNMYLSMANALYMMAKVNPANRHYLLWADQLSSRFKSTMIPSGSAYIWNYHDIILPGIDTHTVNVEDWAHASVDINNALLNYNRGGSWNSNEITKLGHTIYSKMYDGNAADPKLYYRVNGTGATTGEITGYHYDLDRWVNGIWARGEKHKSLTWSGIGAREAMDVSRILQLHPSNSAPLAFTLSSPSNSATEQNTTQVFNWNPSANASDYTLQVSTSSSFATYTVNRPFLTDTNAIVQFLANNQTYYWRVIARNKSGSTITSATRSFITKSPPSFTLSFRHYDSRDSSAATGYWYKQVLVDNTVVWEQDIAADASNSWMDTSVNVTSQAADKSNVEIKFRVINKSEVSNYAFDVYFDQVSLTNTDVVNGGFEKNEGWRYTESGSKFIGGYNTSIKYAGTKSFELALPSNIAASVGKYNALETRWALLQ